MEPNPGREKVSADPDSVLTLGYLPLHRGNLIH